MIQSSPAAGSGTQEALAILNDNPLGDLLFTDLLQPLKLLKPDPATGPRRRRRYHRRGKRRGFERLDQRYGIWQCSELTGTGELVLRR